MAHFSNLPLLPSFIFFVLAFIILYMNLYYNKVYS